MKRKLSLLIMTMCSVIISSYAQNPLAIPPTISGGTYNLVLQQGTTQFYSGITTNTLGANGSLLGPTLIMQKDSAVNITVENQIGEETTIHWHGMHVTAKNDGGPHTIIDTAAIWNPQFTVMDKAGIYWYHPHLHMQTDKHVSKGIAGMIIVKDAEEAALNLPRTYGVDDFPIVMQTKGFDTLGQILIHTELDTSVMVNGTVDAILDAPAQVVRLRLLNGCSQRNMQVGFSGNMAFQLIGTDGGLLEAPVSLTRYMMAPGQRADVLVDLSTMQGQVFSLMSYGSELQTGFHGAQQEAMMGQTIPNYSLNPLNGADYSVMQFNVIAPTGTPVTSIPTGLVTHTPWLEADANATRSLSLQSTNGAVGPFVINGVGFDLNVINETIPLNNIEVWTLSNNSTVAHPFHIHDVQFYILDIDGATPPVEKQGLNDVIILAPMQTARFITQFSDFADDTTAFMYHCHMLTHEDMGMMGQFLVVDNTGVEEVEMSDFSIDVYPNPSVSGQFTLNINEEFNASFYEIYSIDGKLLEKQRVSQNIFYFTIEGRGVYFVKVFSDSKIVSKKLIVN